MTTSAEYKEWADALLNAAVAGDYEANQMYSIALWLGLGCEVDDYSKRAIDGYIARVEELGRDS